jgi:hypothetical protein
MAAPADVTFDVLLGGKITPQLLKSFKDLEELMKKQGSTAKTINAVMGKAYKETFDGASKDAKKSFGEIEHSSKETFHKMIEQAREAQAKIKESFAKVKESINEAFEPLKKMSEWIGLSGVIGAVSGAFVGEELIKEGIKVHRARATEQEVLAGTLRGRGLGAQAPEWAEAAEKLAGQAHIGHDVAMKMMTRLAGKFKSADEAQKMAMSLVGLGGGTAEGAEGALAAYGKLGPMMMAGKVRPTAIAQLGRGGGLGGALLQELSRQTGIAPPDLAKAFGEAKVSKKTGEVTGGALAGAKGVDALNKAILALGTSRGMELVQAHMKGMDGLFYRFGEHWEDFVDKIGEFVEKIIDPIGEEINKLIDSIDFGKVFEEMIEKGKEWGQLAKALWDTIANSPVMNYAKKMWEDFWKTFTGGIELYGPYVETWNDKMHHELGTHMARHMTEAGREWVKGTSERIEGFIKGIIDAFSWFKDNWKLIADGLWKVVEAFLAIKAIEVANQVLQFAKAIGALGLMLTGPAGVVVAVGAVTAYFAKLTENMWKFMGTPEGKKMAGEMEHARMHPGETAAYTATNLAPGEYTTPAARAAAQEGAEYAARTNDKAAEAALRQAESMEKLNKVNEELRIEQQRHKIMIEQGSEALKKFDESLQKSTGNDLKHFDAAIDAATVALMQLSSMQFGGAGGFGLGPGYGGGGGMTEYGASVPGDQPGGPTYDWESYHGHGAYTQNLVPGQDVAMHPAYAQSHYGIKPLDFYISDKDHKRHRWADKTGSKMFDNEDLYRGALGGIFRRPTRALIGESGPEAVVPLSGVGAAAGLGNVTINVNVAGHADDPEAIAAAVERVIRTHYRRSAVV